MLFCYSENVGFGFLKIELAVQKNCCFDVFWVMFNTNYPHFSTELELVASMTSIMARMSPLLNWKWEHLQILMLEKKHMLWLVQYSSLMWISQFIKMIKCIVFCCVSVKETLKILNVLKKKETSVHMPANCRMTQCPKAQITYTIT